jgi:hypothetical protein
MPGFIDATPQRGEYWVIHNESTAGENFAEKWNKNPRLSVAFLDWHQQLLADMDAFRTVRGLDKLGELLSKSFESRPVSRAMEAMTKSVSSARSSGGLSIAPAVGLVTGVSPARATPVPHNTFFGR